MIDLARKYDSLQSPVAVKDSAAKVSYPSLYLTSSDEEMEFPDGEFTTTIKLRKRRYTESEDETGKCTYTVEFDVMGIEPNDAGEDETMEEGDDTAAKSIISGMKQLMAKKA